MSAVAEAPLHSQLLPGDILRVGTVGLRTRKLRTALTATGIAIGIAALVAVMGISSSSRADLAAQLNTLGTNRLEVQAGASFQPGDTAALGDDAVVMVRRIGPVANTSGITTVSATVRRSPYVSESETGGISVQATDSDLAKTLGAPVRDGRFLSRADMNLPTIVLGPDAAARSASTTSTPTRWSTWRGTGSPSSASSGLRRCIRT